MSSSAPDEGNPETILPDSPLGPVSRVVKKSGASQAIGAAMIAVGEIFEPEKTSVEMVQPAGEAEETEGITLDFGHLPPIGPT